MTVVNAVNLGRYQELSDEAIDRATLNELRAAYRSLRDHHIAETASLISRQDDITRRRDNQLAKSNQLIAKADTIMRRDQDLIDRLNVENEHLLKLLADASDQRAFRAASSSDPRTPDRLSDEELTLWAKRSGIHETSMEGTYLRFAVDELSERRSAEARFAEVDQRLQAVECAECNKEPGYCDDHEGLAIAWRLVRDELCEQARIHRGYLRDATTGDP